MAVEGIITVNGIGSKGKQRKYNTSLILLWRALPGRAIVQYHHIFRNTYYHNSQGKRDRIPLYELIYIPDSQSDGVMSSPITIALFQSPIHRIVNSPWVLGKVCSTLRPVTLVL